MTKIKNIFSKVTEFFKAIPDFFKKLPEHLKVLGKGTKDFFSQLFSKKASLDAKKARAGYLFVLPFILGVVLIYLPILIDSICFSFFERINKPGGFEYNFIHFEAYQSAFETSIYRGAFPKYSGNYFSGSRYYSFLSFHSCCS